MGLLSYGIIALAILGMLGGIGYKVRESGKDAVRLEWKEAEEAQAKREKAASDKAAADLAAARAATKVVIQKRTVYVDKIIDRPVYRNQCFDDDGLRCLNAAINGTDATGCKPDGTVPAAKSAG